MDSTKVARAMTVLNIGINAFGYLKTPCNC